MTSVKISELPAAADLSGAELVPVVQGGTTVRTSVSAIRAAGAGVGKHTLWIPARDFVPRATSGAGRSSGETSVNLIMWDTVDFDPATPEYAQATVSLPKSWDRGAITYQVIWTCNDASGAVVWAVKAAAIGDGDALDAVFGSPWGVTDPVTAANAVNVAAESSPLTVGGSPQVGDFLVVQVWRAANNGSDTLAVDALLLGVRIFYTKNAPNDA